MEQGACLSQESTMDGEPPDRTGSKPSRPEDPSATRLLSNPLMGGESRGCGIRVLGRMVNREREKRTGQFQWLCIRYVHGVVWLARIYPFYSCSKMCSPLSAESYRPHKAVRVHSLVKTLAPKVKCITLHWRFKSYL